MEELSKSQISSSADPVTKIPSSWGEYWREFLWFGDGSTAGDGRNNIEDFDENLLNPGKENKYILKIYMYIY